MHNQDPTQLIIKVCLLAGKLILQNGGETSRVEDTMNRIAAAFGIEDSQSSVTPTSIVFATDGATQNTRLVRISERNTNLLKVTLVNDISRRISGGYLSADEAYRQLKDLDEKPYEYREIYKVLAAAVASGCFLIMFNGSWSDFIPVSFIGGFGFLFFLFLHRLVPVKFFAEFLTAIMIGATSSLIVHLGIGGDLDKIIIASVMPLVPGLHITNAVRDLMAGHLVSGLSKGAEAFLTAFAIGAGIATVLSFY